MAAPTDRVPKTSGLPGHAERGACGTRVVAVGEALIDVQTHLRAFADVPTQCHARGAGAARKTDAVHRCPLGDAGIARGEHFALGREGVLPTQLRIEMQLACRGEPRRAGTQAEPGLPTRGSLVVGAEAEALSTGLLEPVAPDTRVFDVRVRRQRERADVGAVADFAVGDVVAPGVVATRERRLVAEAQERPELLERRRTRTAVLEAITPADIAAAADRYLDPAAAVEVRVVPKPAG